MAMGELEDPVVVELPLRVEWSVERTPADRIPSHGTNLLGQRYAYDLVRTDHRPGFRLHPAGSPALVACSDSHAVLARRRSANSIATALKT